MASAAVLERLAEYKNQKEGLLKEVGNLDGITPFGNRVLIAIYVAPSKTKSGLYRTPGQLKEDIYQGTVGLVVRKGPTAFVDDKQTAFNGQAAQVGDWVMFRPGDGKRIQFNGVDCRWIEDLDIDGKIDDPELITYR